MPLWTLPLEPSWSPKKSLQPRVGVYDFGDGYDQRVTLGANPIRQLWNGLLWETLTYAEAATLEAFFEEHKGTEAFEWTPRGESWPRKFICLSWDVAYTAPDIANATADFKEVFDL